MSEKNISRIRRAKKSRIHIRDQESPRLTVSASTVEKDLKIDANNVAGAKEVGKRVAERALENGIKKVVFDRSGYKYHGRIKALADSARDAGLEF
jgi:large subunit ribosomal protein L18